MWKGSTTITSAAGKQEEVAMELHVGPAANSPARTWKIFYGAGEKQTTRNYEIIPVVGEPGRLIMDEKNGIVIDCQVTGNLVLCQFTIATNLVSTGFELQEESLYVEMAMFDTATPRRTKLKKSDITLSSYRFKSIQHGRLARLKAAPEEKRRM